jgi:hypothetical protein
LPSICGSSSTSPTVNQDALYNYNYSEGYLCSPGEFVADVGDHSFTVSKTWRTDSRDVAKQVVVTVDCDTLGLTFDFTDSIENPTVNFTVDETDSYAPNRDLSSDGVGTPWNEHCGDATIAFSNL